MEVLERYRDNSPADKHCLDLVKWGAFFFSSYGEGALSHSFCLIKCSRVQLLDSAWSDLQKAVEVEEEVPVSAGHAPNDFTQLRHPTILLRLFVMSYLRYLTGLFAIQQRKKYKKESYSFTKEYGKRVKYHQ